MSQANSLHEHQDARPNTTVVHAPDGEVLGYIERVALSAPQKRYASFGGQITKAWQPQGSNRRPLTNYVETHDRAIEWVDEQ